MRRNLRQCTIAIITALCLLMTPVAAVGLPSGATTLRIGLYYGAEALPSANLDNNVGSGYQFGYFDSALRFTPLASTSVGQISVMKTQNVYFTNGAYAGSPISQVAVGCYHLELPGNYPDISSAAGAASMISGGFPAWINGSYHVRIGSYPTKEAAAAVQSTVADATVVGTSGYGITVVQTGTSNILFQFDGEAAISFGIKPGLDGTQKAVTWFKGFRYYGSFRYQRIEGGNLSVVNMIDMEDYLKGVVPQEMGKNWPLEALKAQAVCARSYALRTINKHTKNGFDLCATTDCQAYKGLNVAGPISDQAVDETVGEYVVYQGKIAETVYCSSNGGATEDVKNVWNEAVPYLVGVKDPWESTIESSIPNYRWTVTVTATELAGKLRANGYQCANIVDFYVSERSATGNVIAFTCLDSAGKKWTISNRGKELCRTMLGLRSINYSISNANSSAVLPSQPTPSQPIPSQSTGTYYVNGNTNTMTTMTGAYTVDGSGTIGQLGENPFVITGSGVVEGLGSAVESTGTTTSEPSPSGTGVYTITGAGWGHLVGMSQYGANAMAKAGKTYREILTFYFTGIELKS